MPTSTASRRSESEPNVSPIWRWATIFLSGVIVAGTPTMARSLTQPDKADFERVDARSVQNATALAVVQSQLTSQLDANGASIDRLEQRVVVNSAAIEKLRDQITSLIAQRR